jgi:NAD(P)-dependent dehydrogenase (short-subunit alcohol dehydrogenase family)
MNLFDFTGKVALIAGASSGIGAQFAVALAEHGADIILIARRMEKLETVANEIREMGKKVITIKCDVTDEEEVKNAVTESIEKMGKIDILINNAGIEVSNSVENILMEEWDRIITTNLNGTFLMSKYLVPHMKERNYGRIINTSSVLGFVGMKYLPYHAYSAAKGGVIGLTRSMASSLAQYGITVNSIAPGLFETEMTVKTFDNDEVLKRYGFVCPANRVGKKGELNAAVLFFASQAAGYTTGQVLAVDGGWTSI